MPQYMQSSQNPFTGSPRGANREYWASQQPMPSSAQRAADASGARLAAISSANYAPPGGNLLDEYNQSELEARLANERRYANILERGQGRYDTAMDLVSRLGGSEATEIDRQYDNVKGAIGQDMISRGLSNSTIKPTMELASERERTRAHGELRDRMTGRILNQHGQLSGDIMGVMERREDEYPDYNRLQALSQQYGQAAGLGGGYGGGGYTAAAPIMPNGMAYGSRTPQYQMPYGGMPMRGGYNQYIPRETSPHVAERRDAIEAGYEARRERAGATRGTPISPAASSASGVMSGGSFLEPSPLTPGSLFPQYASPAAPRALTVSPAGGATRTTAQIGPAPIPYGPSATPVRRRPAGLPLGNLIGQSFRR